MKCSESLSNRVSNINRGYTGHKKFEAFMAFSFIIFLQVLLVLLFYHCVYGCMFCILLFNSVSYVFLLLCLCIFIVMYVMFCIFCFHCANWHSSAILTEVFHVFPSVVRQMLLQCFFSYCNYNFSTALSINVVFNIINFNCLN